MPERHKITVLLGPTCSWKSQAAVEFAAERGAEIVSCDSMQVYRGLEIGTAQPSMEDRTRVPHHLVGMLDIQEAYDVNVFLGRARAALDDILSRGREAVVVGGTGLYARSLIYGHELLPADPQVFAEMQRIWDGADGRRILEDMLVSAAGSRDAIPKDVLLNPRHLVRACEVLRLTGKLPWLQNSGSRTPDAAYRQCIILPELGMLKERIRRRTALMLAAGWIREAQRAIGLGLMETPTARQALGYRDIAAYLEGDGPRTEEELCEALANRTIQYARRQLTWFRHQHPGAEFITVDSQDGALESILHALKE